MRRPPSSLFACALLLVASVAAAQEPETASAVLRQPADALYPSGRLVIEYSLRQPADRVDIDIFNAKGAVVAGWSGGTAGPRPAGLADRFLLPEALTRQGGQTVTWDLHASGYFAAGVPGAPPRYSPGPLVPPGIYIVQLAASGQDSRQAFKVVPEPPLTAAGQADVEARFDLAMQIRGRASAASAAITRVRALKERVAVRLKASNDPAMTDSGTALVRQLTDVEGTARETLSSSAGLVPLHEALAALRREVEAGGRPTDGQIGRLQELTAALQTHVVSLNALTAGSYARFERGEKLSLSSASPEFGSASVQFDDKGVDFTSWLRVFTARLKKGWSVPPSALTAKGQVAVTFVVHKSGLITDIAVVRPGELAVFNASAHQAVLLARPAPPLPDAYPSETCTFTVTFFFNQPPPTKRTGRSW